MHDAVTFLIALYPKAYLLHNKAGTGLVAFLEQRIEGEESSNNENSMDGWSNHWHYAVMFCGSTSCCS